MTQINISEPWFGYILKGIKTIEGRLCKDKFKSLTSGDMLCINGVVLYKVAGVRRYASFYEMIEQEGLPNVLPGIINIEEGCDIYRQFYKKYDEVLYGVVAIELSQ